MANRGFVAIQRKLGFFPQPARKAPGTPHCRRSRCPAASGSTMALRVLFALGWKTKPRPPLLAMLEPELPPTRIGLAAEHFEVQHGDIQTYKPSLTH
jgi:hypothetical protein